MYENSAMPRARSGSTPLRHSTSLRGVAVACLLLAGFAVSSSASWAVDDTSAPKTAPKPRPAGAKPVTPPAGPAAGNAQVLQRRRQAIARMLEVSFAFRGPLDDGAPRLVEAQLAGPFNYTDRNPFTTSLPTDTLYCALSGVKVSIFPPAYRSALITVHDAPGGERLNAKISLGQRARECYKADFKPFPEIEQLRTQRRRTLGKPE